MSEAFHPLDPLSEGEVRRAVATLREEKGLDGGWRFASIELREPEKSALGRYESSGEPVPREANLVVWDRRSGEAYKAVVSLTAGSVEGWEPRPGEQPNITVDEFHEADEMLRNHPEARAALARRGIEDLGNVLFDVWAYGGSLVAERHRGRRVGWADVWYRDGETTNPYANPVNGLHFVVDLNSVELLEVEDDFAVERPEVMGEYVPEHVPGLELRRDVKPLEIRQPEGVSFTLEGNLLEWQKWTMRIGFNYREGLVLHRVGYRDEQEGGRTRSVAHRLSFAEMVVPYRDPSPDHYRRTAFDVGEWGLGFMTTSLALGCDCLGEIRYIDAVLHDSKGEPYTIKNAVCIHEEDDALLWKHVDDRAGSEVRRSRRLVVSFHATVANYEYIVYWRFYQDGNIECEVRATGIMVTTAFEGEKPPYGTLVDNRTYAPHHQHFLVARLDLDVDGEQNTVYMSESEALPVSEENPHGLALVQRETPLRTESEGKQDYRWETQRSWKVVNDERKNALGTSVGYKLVPGACFPAMMDPDSPVMKRAGVIGHNLWVTPYSPEERWPCGEFVNQSEADTGLPAWTEADRAIEATDVVLWYVFGIHHITRPEDWPVMPSDTVSFWLKPVGFFSRNPALDVPPESREDEHCGTR
ncbi:Cu2+-containing amine oxidase [Rubrobacter radiotolerans]|uniref:Amine oxidase n=1 Tax=Rubrobacter radiotolerans TaxID=42256 RepID=A0A023X0P1_RUBRA|nr:primary-amine oxidase [Rubrobacter radiotolerans]AHY45614.1 Cu2+-containing amine oxidase [Rubrobacter radiotolerans]MDX5893027.1 primary-amine oxidase [Rubrobacter radiotolerans]SMC02927.1 primary-amine oxidase [Rubrobacter radiotolerans DSM 5868]